MHKINIVFLVIALAFFSFGFLFYQRFFATSDREEQLKERESVSEENDLTQWVLNDEHAYQMPNGIRVYILETPFEKNEVNIRLIFLRGYADEIISKRASAELALDVIWESGFGQKNADELSAWLYEHEIELSFKVYPFHTQVDATLPKDQISLYAQMVSRFIEESKIHSSAASAVKNKVEKYLETKNQARTIDLEDAYRMAQFPNVPQLQSLKLSDLKTFDPEDAYVFFKKLAQQPSKILVNVVGDVNANEVYQLLEEKWKNWKEDQTLISNSQFDFKNLRQQESPRQFVFPLNERDADVIKINFRLHEKIDHQNFVALEFFAQLVEERLRQVIISSTGSSHGIDVSYEFPLYPYLDPTILSIQLKTEPARTNEILSFVLSQLEALKVSEISLKELELVQNYNNQTDKFWKKDNIYWLDSLTNYYLWDWPFSTLVDSQNTMNHLKLQTAQSFIEKAFDFEDRIVIIGKTID